MLDNNLKNLSPIVIRSAMERFSQKGNAKEITERAHAWQEIVVSNPDLSQALRGTVLLEQMTRCDPRAAISTHMAMIDFGFNIALELHRRGALDSEAVEAFGIGFRPRRAA